MSPKAAKTPLFDKSAHSSTKEIIRGSSSNWVGSPKEVIRDTSHHNEPASGPKSPRRSSKNSVDIANDAKAFRRRSTSGKNVSKSERKRSTGKSETKHERRKSIGRYESKPERRKSEKHPEKDENISEKMFENTGKVQGRTN
jgi:hypothetical protein